MLFFSFFYFLDDRLFDAVVVLLPVRWQGLCFYQSFVNPTPHGYFIDLDPNDRFTHYHQGLILYTLDRTEEALDAYERSIQLNPEDDFVYQCKVDALYDLERYEQALIAYEQALQLDPKYASAHKGKGDAFYELKRYKEALAT